MAEPTSTHDLRAICARLPGNELAAAECASLAGGIPDAEGVAHCLSLAAVPQAAYVRTGLRCYAEAPDLESLAQQIGQTELQADGFHIDFLRLAESNPLSKQAAVLAAADAIQTYPDLHHPQHRFLLVAQSGRLWFGEILSECTHSYKQHDAKPYRTSSSLPSRLARALVNLVAGPGGQVDSILDPFCGSGSILLEAQALGLAALGMDNNFKMTGMTRRNLAHFGYRGEVLRGDALTCPLRATAIVTDLPYGRLLQEMDTAAELRPILEHLAQQAQRAVYLAEQDLSGLLAACGYTGIQVYRVRKHQRMSRFVHLARSQAA